MTSFPIQHNLYFPWINWTITSPFWPISSRVITHHWWVVPQQDRLRDPVQWLGVGPDWRRDAHGREAPPTRPSWWASPFWCPLSSPKTWGLHLWPHQIWQHAQWVIMPPPFEEWWRGIKCYFFKSVLYFRLYCDQRVVLVWERLLILSIYTISVVETYNDVAVLYGSMTCLLGFGLQVFNQVFNENPGY